MRWSSIIKTHQKKRTSKSYHTHNSFLSLSSVSLITKFRVKEILKIRHITWNISLWVPFVDVSDLGLLRSAGMHETIVSVSETIEYSSLVQSSAIMMVSFGVSQEIIHYRNPANYHMPK